MPYRAFDLRKAIYHQDLDTLQAILHERDTNGMPLFDLNQIGPHGESALLWAFASGDYSVEVIQFLLNVRDGNGNPILNLNSVDNEGCNLLNYLLMEEHDNQRKLKNRRVLELCLDARDIKGNLRLDITAQNTKFSPLEQATYLGDLDMFRMLIDCRDAKGEKILDINQITNASTEFTMLKSLEINPETYRILNHLKDDEGFTPSHFKLRIFPDRMRFAYMHSQISYLEEAFLQRGPYFRNEPLPERDVAPRPEIPLPHNLDLRNEPLPLERVVVPRPEIPLPHNLGLRNEPLPLERVVAPRLEIPFHEQPQNTHASEVTQSINVSIHKLRLRYSAQNQVENLAAVQKYLQSLPASKTSKIALACFNRIKTEPTVRGQNQATLAEVLSLIWQAIHDKQALTQDTVKLTEADIELRKQSLVSHLYQAQTEYGNRSACFVGTFNKIIETLDRCHPDVRIIRSENEIMPYALERTLALAIAALVKKPIRVQKQIIRDWDDDTSENSVVANFKKNRNTYLEKELQQEFGHLVTRSKRQEILDQLEYLPKPLIHRRLNNLIAEIQQLTPHNEIFGHTKRVTSLQRLAAEAYADNEIPFEEIYQNMLKAKQKLEELQVFATKLNPLKRQYDTALRQAAIEKLERLAIEAEQQDEFAPLLKQLNHLKRLDNLRHKVGELKFSRDCKAYQLACIYLAQEVDSAYAKPDAGEKLVSALEQHYEKLIHSRQAVRAYHQAITQLQDHGNKRFAKDYPEAKRSVDKLVTDLNSKLQNYLTTPTFNNKIADRFIKESKNSIKQADAILSQHRGWKKVIYNVGICLTGIGTVVLGAKNIYSYAKSGQLSFFKVQTDSNAKLLVIKDQLAELAKPMLPVINS